MKRVAVLGGGVSGLTAAFTLRTLAPELDVVLVESRDRLGGNIVTEHRDGFLIDGGPDSFLRTKPQAVDLVKELGLGDDLIVPRPEARRVYVAHRGRLELMPGGMALAVPTRVGPMLQTPLLSLSGKLRMLGELLVSKRADSEDDESIGSFLARRFGAEASARLGAPLLGGIYAGEVDQLSLRATFPQLLELEAAHGSLIYGFFAAQLAREGRPKGRFLTQLPALLRWLQRAEQEAPSPFHSLKRGLGSLIDALAARLPPESIRLERPLSSIVRLDDNRLRLTVGGDALDVDAAVFALPAHAAAAAVGASLGAELAAIPYVSTATAFLAFRREDVAHPLDGSGFIAPKGEAELIAATWVSSKWAHRAPEGHVLMRAFFGGARGGEQLPNRTDTELLDAAHRELSRLMGTRLGEPLFGSVYRYHRSNPQPLVGHQAKVRRATEQLTSLGIIELAGAAYDGVGIPDCVRQARTAAKNVIERLATR